MQPELREGEAQRLRDLERAKLLTWLDGDAPFPGKYAVASVLDALAASQKKERQAEFDKGRLVGELAASQEKERELREAAQGNCPTPTESNLPQRIVVGANGAYWRYFEPDGVGTLEPYYSMCPVSSDNDPVEVVAVYERVALDSQTHGGEE